MVTTTLIETAVVFGLAGLGVHIGGQEAAAAHAGVAVALAVLVHLELQHLLFGDIVRNHAHKVPLVVDNTFATPYLVRPFEYGADIVVHSATKFIGGHGTSLGGVIVENGKFDWEGSGKFPHLCTPNPSYHGVTFTKAAPGAAFVTAIRAMLLRDMGGCISPFHAFIFLQGLETLSLRVERHVENALKVVQYLNNHPQVERVHHPSVSTDPEQQELYKKYFPNGGC